MNTTTIRLLKTKSGNEIPEGANVLVLSSPEGRTALISDGSVNIRVPMLAAGRYLKGFLSIEQASKKLKNAIKHDHVTVPSMTDKRVEADGWDEHGMPSILIAGGYI